MERWQKVQEGWGEAAATKKLSHLEDAPRPLTKRGWATSTGAAKRVFALAISFALALAFAKCFPEATELSNLAEN